MDRSLLGDVIQYTAEYNTSHPLEDLAHYKPLYFPSTLEADYVIDPSNPQSPEAVAFFMVVFSEEGARKMADRLLVLHNQRRYLGGVHTCSSPQGLHIEWLRVQVPEHGNYQATVSDATSVHGLSQDARGRRLQATNLRASNYYTEMGYSDGTYALLRGTEVPMGSHPGVAMGTEELESYYLVGPSGASIGGDKFDGLTPVKMSEVWPPVVEQALADGDDSTAQYF